MKLCCYVAKPQEPCIMQALVSDKIETQQLIESSGCPARNFAIGWGKIMMLKANGAIKASDE